MESSSSVSSKLSSQDAALTYAPVEKKPKIEESDNIFDYFPTRSDCISNIVNSKYGRASKFDIHVDSNGRGGKTAKIICKGCNGFYAFIRQKSYGYCIDVNKEKDYCLTHYSTVGDTSAPCTGGFKVVAKISDVKENPVANSLMKLQKSHDHSRRVGNGVFQAVLGSSEIPLVASNHVINKAVAQMKVNKDDHIMGYTKLEAWLEELMSINAGIKAQVERLDGTNNLDYVVLKLPYAAADIVPHLLPIFALDSAFMKPIPTGRLEQLESLKIMALVGRSTANHNIPLAVMICRHEGGREYQILCESVGPETLAVINTDRVIVTCDGSPAAATCFKKGGPLDKAHQLRCEEHLKRNINAKPQWSQHMHYFKSARNATTRAQYLEVMSVLRSKHFEMYSWLIEVEHWQLYEVVEKGLMAFALHSDNQVEQFFSWLLPMRDQSPYFFMRSLCMRVFETLSEHSEESRSWDGTLTPLATRLFEQNKLRLRTSGFQVDVASADKTRFNVTHIRFISCRSETFLVTLADGGIDGRQAGDDGSIERSNCSCQFWTQTGVPCDHAICVLDHLGILDCPSEFFTVKYFHPLSFTSNLKDMYGKLSVKGGYICPSDSGVDARMISGNFIPLVPTLKDVDTSLDTRRIRSAGEASKAGTVSWSQYQKEKKPCHSCGKVLAVSSFPRHTANVEACKKFKEEHPDMFQKAKEY